MANDISKNYENLPLSEKTNGGMSINVDDQKWFKLLMDRQDEITQTNIESAYCNNAKIICDGVKGMLDEHKKEIFKALAKIENSIKELRIEIKGINVEIKSINVEIKGIKIDIDKINGDMTAMKKTVAEHQFHIDHINKHLGL